MALGLGRAQPVTFGARVDSGRVEGDPVDDGSHEPWVGDGPAPFIWNGKSEARAVEDFSSRSAIVLARRVPLTVRGDELDMVLAITCPHYCSAAEMAQATLVETCGAMTAGLAAAEATAAARDVPAQIARARQAAREELAARHAQRSRDGEIDRGDRASVFENVVDPFARLAPGSRWASKTLAV